MPSSHEIRQYLNITHTISASFSFIFNSILIVLVLTKSPKHLGVYKYLMVFISSFEMVYSLFDVFLKPFHYAYKAIGMVLLSTTDKPLGATALVVLDSIYWGFFGASLAIFALHFIYRYLAVSENPLLESFSSWRIVFWMLLPMCSFLTWMVTGFFLCGPNEVTTGAVSKQFQADFGRSIEEFVYLGFYLYENDNNGIIVHWVPTSGVTISVLTITISLGVILFFGYKCYHKIFLKLSYSGTTSSSSSTNLQAQLFLALIIQTSIPALLMHFPVAIIFSFIIAGKGFGVYTSIVSFTIALYPAIDPLPNFFLIAPYRNAILGAVRRLKNRGVEPSSATVATSRLATC